MNPESRVVVHVIHMQAGQDAQRSGDTHRAREEYERALRTLPHAGHPDADKILRWIAWTFALDGSPHAALDCLDAAEAVSEARGDERELAYALNTRAGVLYELGRLDACERLFLRARSMGERLEDRKIVAMADQNIGSVLSIRGDAVRAISRFETSLAGFRALGEWSYLGPLLNNIGRLQIDLGELGPAAQSLDEARHHCEREDDLHHLTIVEVNRAWIHLRTGQVEQALRKASAAFHLSRQARDDRWLAEINHVAGAARVRSGDAERGLTLLESALEFARDREDPKILAQLLLERARALRLLGRNRETLESLNQARALFAELRAQRDLEVVTKALGDLEMAFLDIVLEWGQSIEDKDAYTQGHCARVADHACALAMAVGFPASETEWFRMGALLHDVGKVAVPSEVLNKPGRLNDEEWALMARHPVLGVELLEDIEFPWDVRPMIRHHHERFDGTGYPDRLAGYDIPLSARILTIADIFDALTTTRSYRPAMSKERAVEILREEAGVTVDPTLVEIFIEEVVPDIVIPDVPAQLQIAV